MLDTLRPVLEILAWSFRCLFSGKHPSLNWSNEAYNGRHKAGTPIAGWFNSTKRAEQMVQLCGRFKNWASCNSHRQLGKPGTTRKEADARMVCLEHVAWHSLATMPAGLLDLEQGTYPVLKLKAWNGRLMILFLAVALKGLSEPGDDLLRKERRAALAAAECVACIFDRSERAARLLTEQEAESISEAILKFLMIYKQLVKISVSRNCPRYKIIPKMHALLHVGEDVRDTRCNFRHFHCFMDEDYIGQMKELTIKLPKVGGGLEYRLLTRWLLRLGASRPLRAGAK
ncbi:unnamed protein product [Symbiodinium sp. CCMP2592]|nr:unnamed protein product [Symbiodinium sp. CCMP2592]